MEWRFESDTYTREKFAIETIAVWLRPVYTKHDWHELYSGADRKELGGEQERENSTPHPRLKYNRVAKYVWI